LIDSEGFRLNVGIIVMNDHKKLLWARRIGTKNAWQFPQGGIQENESPEAAMYRELKEELGLLPEDVEIIKESEDWLGYRLPKAFRRYHSKPLCIGQKQKWFLLRLLSPENKIKLDSAPTPEFEEWHWVDYWYPARHVIQFKQAVYRAVLKEFEHYDK
jgi:putative (di)nucleoside polyphosphate hydrolase